MPTISRNRNRILAALLLGVQLVAGCGQLPLTGMERGSSAAKMTERNTLMADVRGVLE